MSEMQCDFDMTASTMLWIFCCLQAPVLFLQLTTRLFYLISFEHAAFVFPHIPMDEKIFSFNSVLEHMLFTLPQKSVLFFGLS